MAVVSKCKYLHFYFYDNISLIVTVHVGLSLSVADPGFPRAGGGVPTPKGRAMLLFRQISPNFAENCMKINKI